MNRLKKMTVIAILACLGAVLGIFENMLPILTAVPGGKLGVANTVTVIVIYVLGASWGFAVSVLRVIITCMLYGGINAFMYSFAGAASSFAAMWVAKKLLDERVSPVGISVLGAAFHNAAQVGVAYCVLRTNALLWYLGALLLISLVSGTVCGRISYECIKRIDVK